MDKPVKQVYQTLQKLIGIHRQLLENIRIEHEALVQADLSGIQVVTLAKQNLLEETQHVETERLQAVSELAVFWKKPFRELTLNEIVIQIQATDQKAAEQFRTALNVLSLLMKRMTEQNEYNKVFVKQALEHIQEMKKNALSQGEQSTQLYNHSGKKSKGVSNHSRLISKEV